MAHHLRGRWVLPSSPARLCYLLRPHWTEPHEAWSMSDKLEFSIDGIDELIKRFANLDKEGRKRVRIAINSNALDFQRSVKKSIRKNTGRHIKYRRGGKNHWSSSPRRAPNSDSGNLVKNVRVTVRATNASLGAVVVSGAKYSSALEFGHKLSRRGGRRTYFVTAPSIRQGLSYVAPRPFMIPMLKRKTRQYISNIQQALNGAIVTRGGVTNRAMNNRITSGRKISLPNK